MYDEQLRKLIEQFRAKFLELSNEDIQRLVEETRAEALAEARAIIKEQMLQAILEQSARLQAHKAMPQPATAAQPTVAQPAEAPKRPPFETPRVTLVSRPETPPAPPSEKSAQATPAPAAVETEQNGSEIEGARQILREIENLRQQLSANEEWLTRGSSAEDEADHAGT
ncbi:MAG: translation initiation factor IF-2 [Rhodothermus sp.]|nr:translation initiation factor IF-2 [Rhodothermus sp.]